MATAPPTLRREVRASHYEKSAQLNTPEVHRTRPGSRRMPWAQVPQNFAFFPGAGPPKDPFGRVTRNAWERFVHLTRLNSKHDW